MGVEREGLTVVHGPFEALEDAFADRIRDLKPRAGGRPVLVVAPSRVMADRLERLLAFEKKMPLAGVHFHTFHSLAAAVVEEAGFPDAALVSDPVFHDAVVDRVLDRAPSLGIANELRPRAFASAVRASLRDLIDSGVEPGLIAEHFGSTLIADDEEAARLNALLGLLAMYDRELSALGVTSPSFLVRRAAESAEASPWLSSFSEILYYGFYDLTGLQLEFFEAVTRSRASQFYFPYRQGHPAFRFSDEFFEQKLSGYPRIALADGDSQTVLGGALDALFDPAKPPHSIATGGAALVSASGARDEAWSAAKEALRLLDAGVPAYEIAIIARSLESYRTALAEAFAAENLPLDLSCGEPILRQPLAKAALDLLTLRERDFPARTVEDLAGSPYFTAASPKRAARWRRLVDALGIRAGWLQWRGKLEPRLGHAVELKPHRVSEGGEGEMIPAEDAQSLWGFISGLREKLGTPPAAWSERSAQARDILSAHLRLPRDAAPAERDAWDAVQRALEELKGFDRLAATASWREFLDAFERKLARATRDAGNGLLGVRALDAMDARGQRFRAVVLIGLKEKLFPRQVAEDPMLRDGARAVLRHPAGYWIGRKAAGHEEERLLFYLTVSAAKEHLVLVYPRSDEAGKASTPSIYLRELCRAAGLPAPGVADARRVPRQPEERLRSTPAESRTPREASLLRVLEGGAPDLVLSEVDAGVGPLIFGLNRIVVLNERGTAGSYDGQTRPIVSELAKLKKYGISPTALDVYAQCPFRFFASRVLGLGDREEGSDRGELTPQARGLVYHAVLERFYKDYFGRDNKGDHGDWGPTFHAAITAVFEKNDWRALGLYPLLWESARIDMSARLLEFIRWDLARLKEMGLSPRLYETRLQGEPPEGAPGGVPWKGIADRIDEERIGHAFHVVDYKTRSNSRWKNLAKQASAGRLHQLPFYAELGGAALGRDKVFAGAELLFIEVEEGEDRLAELSAEDWSLARGPFLKILAQRVEAISSGRFPIRPEEREGGHCAWCDFPTVCRKAHAPSRARALRVTLPGESGA